MGQTATVDFKPLFDKWPPRHPNVHRPKRRETNNRPLTIIDRLPNQGTVNWKKQDSIPIGTPTSGLWDSPPVRGLTIMKKKKGGKK